MKVWLWRIAAMYLLLAAGFPAANKAIAEFLGGSFRSGCVWFVVAAIIFTVAFNVSALRRYVWRRFFRRRRQQTLEPINVVQIRHVA